MRRANCLALILIALVSLWMASGASAAAGLDPTFGEGGVVHLPKTETAEGTEASAAETAQNPVAIEPDGSLVLATNRTLERLDPAGHLDPSFGEAGTVVPPPPSGGTIDITGAALAAEGKLLVVATSHPAGPKLDELPLHFAYGVGSPLYEAEHTEARIYRYLPNGQLDPTFGEGGIVETTFGLPARSYQGVKLSAQPVVETTGVAVDGEGRVIVTGGVPAGAFGGGCYHDDWWPTITWSAFVARLTPTGQLDTSFARDGVFGGRSARQNPLSMEDAARPIVTPDDGVLYQRGPGHCADVAGALGYVRLTSSGALAVAAKPKGSRRVFDATVAPDGSVFLLLYPSKGRRNDPELVEKLRPNGSPDSSFGHDGLASLRLPGYSYATRLRLAPDGDVLLSGVKVPMKEGRYPLYGHASPMLIGLTANGARDTRIGPKGIAATHLQACYESTELWVDDEGRATLTAHCEARYKDNGLVAIRFVLPR